MKSYKILTLGASGAGKTVFMASMFRSLSTQGEDGFYLEVEDFESQKLLNDIYTNLIIGKWPETTRRDEISKWKFTCCINNLNLENFPICQFIYFDYAGGRFTDMDEEDSNLQEIIVKADAILGLLDGQKIQALMTNNNQENIDDFLNKDLPPIIKWMSYCQTPIQFVISKWDLLENENFGLKEISDRLLEIPEFKELVINRNQEGSPVRLIPVSSIGSGFATPQPDGSMKKIAGSIPRPFHMEVPVSCVIPDLLEKEIQVNLKRLTTISDASIAENSGFNKLLNKFFKGALSYRWLIDIVVNTLVEILTSIIFKDDSDRNELNIIIAKESLKRIDDLVLGRMRKKVEADEKKLAEFRKIRDESIANLGGEVLFAPEPIHNFTKHEKVVCSVGFTSDGKTLFSSSDDRTVLFWDVARGNLQKKIVQEKSDWVLANISQDNKLLFTASADKSIKVWDANTGKLLYKPLKGHSEPIDGFVVSPDGSTLISGSRDRTVKIWQLETNGEPALNLSSNSVCLIDRWESRVVSKSNVGRMSISMRSLV
ncbi:MAG: hypothetical protein F6K24_01445 [Okeania sp. SIO2D1]|nr:hypothetical protein [Okeania sp. SIO2D1]